MFGGASKPLASLSSGLLARKGQARPAMRPQGFASLAGIAQPLEDLGWNDMGSVEQALPVQPVARPVAEVTQPPVQPVPQPPVLAEREALREEVEGREGIETPNAADTPDAPDALRAERSVSVATATRLARESAAQTRKGKAAFTLRLDAERHLRLRLAAALTGRSAQALVTGAVDELIRGLPEVDLLVAQLPAGKKVAGKSGR